jgi:hypothetical protein
MTTDQLVVWASRTGKSPVLALNNDGEMRTTEKGHLSNYSGCKKTFFKLFCKEGKKVSFQKIAKKFLL